MRVHKELRLPNQLSEYVGLIVTDGLRDMGHQEFALKHGMALGRAVTPVTNIAPERYMFVAKAMWQSVREGKQPYSVFTGDVVFADTEQRFTTAINKDVTLFLGAIATGATTAEFVLFTPCCGLSKQFNNNVVFITA